MGVDFLAHHAHEPFLRLDRIIDQRIRPELRERALDILCRLHLAGGRPAQIGARRLGQQPHPHLPDGLGRPHGQFRFLLL